MNVIDFAAKPHQDGTWRTSELNALRTTFAAELANGDASGWHAASTDVGDPQFYLIGPPPDETCVLAISRLGRLYILEDGTGHVLFEHVNLERLTQKAVAYLRENKIGLVARVALLWGACRQVFHEKIEPMMAEGEEMLVHVAPQLVAIV